MVSTVDGRTVRGRAYPWGTIEVENESHCDFVKLRQMLIHTHMEELREHTNDVLYEGYRSEKLIAMGVNQDASVFKEIKSVSVGAEIVSRYADRVEFVNLLALPPSRPKSANCTR